MEKKELELEQIVERLREIGAALCSTEAKPKKTRKTATHLLASLIVDIQDEIYENSLKGRTEAVAKGLRSGSEIHTASA
jgi:F0F1-type ATP synthase delta subunit